MSSKASNPSPIAEADVNSDTRARIVAAARQELVSHGFAGARVDRIARLAGTSKERIYFYFKSKVEIAREVQADQANRFTTQVRFDPDNVEAFVADVFDFYYYNRDDVRLWLWFLLELGDTPLPPDDFRVVSVSKRVEAVRAAQAQGKIHPDWDPVVLLNMISSLAMSHILAPVYVHELSDRGEAPTSPEWIERHRAAVLEISHRILEVPPTKGSAASIPPGDRRN